MEKEKKASLIGPDLQIIIIFYLIPKTNSYVLVINQSRFPTSFYLWNTHLHWQSKTRRRLLFLGTSVTLVRTVKLGWEEMNTSRCRGPLPQLARHLPDSMYTAAGPCLSNLSHHSASILTRLRTEQMNDAGDRQKPWVRKVSAKASLKNRNYFPKDQQRLAIWESTLYAVYILWLKDSYRTGTPVPKSQACF